MSDYFNEQENKVFGLVTYNRLNWHFTFLMNSDPRISSEDLQHLRTFKTNKKINCELQNSIMTLFVLLNLLLYSNNHLIGINKIRTSPNNCNLMWSNI
jgi:hypothetical protein